MAKRQKALRPGYDRPIQAITIWTHPEPPILEQINAKLDRADECITNLEREIDAFLDGAGKRTLTYDKPEEAEAFKGLHQSRPLPIRFSILAGEILHQIRTCLDYINGALIECDGGTVGTQSNFPIFTWKPATKDEIAAYQRNVKGIKRTRVLACIKRHQPYQRRHRRGGHWLGILKTLNNRDKHRSLTFYATAVDARISYEIEWPNGMFGGGSGPDDGTMPTVSFSDTDGKMVKVMNVQRDLTAQVVMEWGDTGLKFPITRLMREGFLKGTRDIVKELAPFVTNARRRI